MERNIVERVFTLGDRCVESIMTPRNAMESIDISLSNAEISEIVEKTQHSVYPITRGGSLDDIIGTVKLESLFGKLGNPNFSVLSVVKPAHFFKEDTQVYSALEQMRELRLKNAIISNEFGVTLGMVTLKRSPRGKHHIPKLQVCKQVFAQKQPFRHNVVNVIFPETVNQKRICRTYMNS